MARIQSPTKSKTEKVFAFIVNFKLANDGNSPSMLEIMNATGISSSSVLSYYLERLEKQGKISREYTETDMDGVKVKNRTRMISVVGAKWNPPTTDTVAA